MTPKSLLRNPLAVSCLEDLSIGKHFEPVLGEQDEAIKSPTRLIICSGKVYYDLLQARMDADIKTVALIRVEELYPFPEDILVEHLKKYKHAEVIWCQEEPENMGGWHFVDRLLEKAMVIAGMVQSRPIYVGRKASASPATGLATIHEKEQAELVRKALVLKIEKGS
jgi:2-oxoglutarate dehydrogenase E1 component